jgi:hypothetical protein
MSIENNPLKQYFRRPSIYLKLPSKGVDYSPDVVSIPDNGEIPIYPMTAIDEITSKTPDSLYNGTAVADIIRSCVPAIRDPWKISSTDLDAILVAVRIATNGNDMDIETHCPKCDEDFKYGINLSFILNNFVAGDYSNPITMGDLQVKFRPLNYKELTENAIRQFEIQKALTMITSMEDTPERDKKSSDLYKTIALSTLDIIASTIASISSTEFTVTEKAYILDFLQNADKRIVEKIKEKSLSLRETTQMKPLEVKCSGCGHDYEQMFTLNVSDFFV